LGVARLVDQQAAVRCCAEVSVGIQRHLVQHGPLIPRRVSEHVLQLLVVRLNDRLFHPLHVLACRLHQTLEVVSGGAEYRAGLALKMRQVAPMEAKKSICDPINSFNVVISIFK
jgi:hypothetical protein